MPGPKGLSSQIPISSHPAPTARVVLTSIAYPYAAVDSYASFESKFIAPLPLEGTPILYHQAWKYFWCTLCNDGVTKTATSIGSHVHRQDWKRSQRSIVVQAALAFDAIEEPHHYTVPKCASAGRPVARLERLPVFTDGFSCQRCSYATLSPTGYRAHTSAFPDHRFEASPVQFLFGNVDVQSALHDHKPLPSARAHAVSCIVDPVQVVVDTTEVRVASERHMASIRTPHLSSEEDDNTMRDSRTPLRTLNWNVPLGQLTDTELYALANMPSRGDPLSPPAVHQLCHLKEHDPVPRRVDFMIDVPTNAGYLGGQISLAIEHLSTHALSESSPLRYRLEAQGDYNRLRRRADSSHIVNLLFRLAVFTLRCAGGADPLCHRLSRVICMPDVHRRAAYEFGYSVLQRDSDPEKTLKYLFTLFYDTHPEGIRSSGKRWILPTFLRAISLDYTGAFRPTPQIRTMIGNLGYAARAVFLGVGNCEFQAICKTDDDLSKRTIKFCNDKLTLLNEAPTPFRHLVHTRQIFASDSDPLGNSHDSCWNGNTITVGQSRFSFDIIGNVARVAIDQCWAILHRHLLLSSEPPEELDPKFLFDYQANYENGYSFLSHPANPFQTAHKLLLDLVLDTDTEAHNQFQPEMLDHKLRLAPRAVLEYLRHTQTFLLYFATALMLTSGGSPRGSELLNIKWANRPCSIRDVFIHNGSVLGVFQWEKPNSVIDGHRSHPRQFLPALGKIYIIYIAIVKPFELWLAEHHFGKFPVWLRSHVFIHHSKHKLLETSHLSNHLRTEFARFDSFHVDASTYRQGASMIATRFGPEISRPAGPSLTSALVPQFGHSELTNVLHYSDNEQVVAQRATLGRDAFIKASEDWQVALGLENYQPRDSPPPAVKADPPSFDNPLFQRPAPLTLRPLTQNKLPLMTYFNSGATAQRLPSAPIRPYADPTKSDRYVPPDLEDRVIHTQIELASMVSETHKRAAEHEPSLPCKRRYLESSNSTVSLADTIIATPPSPIHDTAVLAFDSKNGPACPIDDNATTPHTHTQTETHGNKVNAHIVRDSAPPQSIAGPAVTTDMATFLLSCPLDEQRLRSLKAHIGKTGFRDHNQVLALHVIDILPDDVLLHLPPGSGKTLLWAWASQLPRLDGRVTLIVCPVKALLSDLVHNCRSHGFFAQHWNPRTAPSQLTVIPVWDLNNTSFKTWISSHGASIGRVVVEEAHLWVTTSYRLETLKPLGFLRQQLHQGTQFICSTASVPPAVRPHLASIISSQRLIVLSLPSFPVAPLIHIYPRVHKDVDGALIEDLRRYLSTLDETRQVGGDAFDQVLVFCDTVSQVDAVSEALGWPQGYYRGQQDSMTPLKQAEIESSLADFRLGRVRRLASTNAAAMGLNFPELTHVILLGCQDDLVELVQKAGRAGRSPNTASRARLTIFPTTRRTLLSKRPKESAILGADIGVMLQTQEAGRLQDCPRALISKHLDGRPMTCRQQGSPLCEYCLRMDSSIVYEPPELAMSTIIPTDHLELYQAFAADARPLSTLYLNAAKPANQAFQVVSASHSCSIRRRVEEHPCDLNDHSSEREADDVQSHVSPQSQDRAVSLRNPALIASDHVSSPTVKKGALASQVKGFIFSCQSAAKHSQHIRLAPQQDGHQPDRILNFQRSVLVYLVELFGHTCLLCAILGNYDPDKHPRALRASPHSLIHCDFLPMGVYKNSAFLAWRAALKANRPGCEHRGRFCRQCTFPYDIGEDLHRQSSHSGMAGCLLQSQTPSRASDDINVILFVILFCTPIAAQPVPQTDLTDPINRRMLDALIETSLECRLDLRTYTLCWALGLLTENTGTSGHLPN